MIHYDKDLRTSETEYVYQTVNTLGTHEERTQRQFFAPTANEVTCNPHVPFIRNGQNDIRVGIDQGNREQPISLMRRKIQRYAETPGGPLVTS